MGRRARAAWSAVWMVVRPCAPRVTAEDTMMANMTATAEAMPATTSRRMRRQCSAFTGPGARADRPARFRSSSSSSTSSLACQKNR